MNNDKRDITPKYLKALGKLPKLLTTIQYVVLWVGSVALLLWLVPPVREWLKSNGFLNIEVVIALIGLLVAMGINAFRDLKLQIDATSVVLDNRIIDGGVANVYPHLATICDSLMYRRVLTKKGPKILEVLGLTLFSAWPRVRGFIEDGHFNGWHIRLFCLDPEYIRNNTDVIPSRWAKEVENKTEEIVEYVGQRKQDLDSRNISFELSIYTHLPALHGFRVQRRDVICSFIQWNSSCLDDPFQFYECFPFADKSIRAENYRQLFENWINAASERGKILIKTNNINQ